MLITKAVVCYSVRRETPNIQALMPRTVKRRLCQDTIITHIFPVLFIYRTSLCYFCYYCTDGGGRGDDGGVWSDTSTGPIKELSGSTNWGIIHRELFTRGRGVQGDGL